MQNLLLEGGNSMNKKIKICFISLGSYPLFNKNIKRTFGGAEVQMYLLAKEISKDNQFEVSFIVGDYGQKKIEKYGKIQVIRGMKFEKPSLANWIIPKNKIRLFHAILKANSDIYIQRAASGGTGIIRVITRILRKKFVYMSAHEIDCNGGFEKQNSKPLGFLFKYGIKNANLIITQRKEHKEMIKKHHHKESIVMNSVYEIPRLKNTNQSMKKTILWVGRCEDWKRPELFLEIAKENPKEKFVMISPPAMNNPVYASEIKKEAKKISNLQFVDFVPFNEIDSYFKKAKMFVITSKYEGFPNTLIQAAKNKTPIFSMSINPDNLFKRYDLGFYSNDSYELLSKEIKIILKDPKKLAKKGDEAYRYAKENHDVKKITKVYKSLLYNLVYEK